MTKGEWFAVCVEDFDGEAPPNIHHVIWSSGVGWKWEAVKAANEYDCPPGYRMGVKPYLYQWDRVKWFREKYGFAVWLGSPEWRDLDRIHNPYSRRNSTLKR